MVNATDARQPTRHLAGTPQPPADRMLRSAGLLSAARLIAGADGPTLTTLRAAALAIRSGNEAEAIRILEAR